MKRTSENQDMEQGSGGGGRAAAKDVRPRVLGLSRVFSVAGVEPADAIEWETRDAQITGEGGASVFEQKGLEVPKAWSQLATNVVASKYFRGPLGTPEREHSVRQLVSRVVTTIGAWGRKDGYFADEAEAKLFEDELATLIYEQKMSFNSPVWFNVGVEEHPQCSACFINGVEDSMDAILRLAHTEGMLFKYGSGAGSNLSKLRSSRELLRGGGEASGPVSFMRGFDAFAGVIKSGGKTRRAAKMVILDVDHPDIGEFISCKATEEKKAHALIDAGYDGGFNVRGGAYDSIFFQNANHSIRVSDAFMRAAAEDREWYLTARTDGRTLERVRARELLRSAAEAAWACGDPGVQFDTTINAWNTVPNAGRINASNPCSEYLGVDDSACNLASLNLLAFRGKNGHFDADAFYCAVQVTILAQEIVVASSRYPTPAIEKNSHELRPLGLGYANLGAYLMAAGVPYDSDAGRAMAGAITAMMTASAFVMSARIASRMGPFAAFGPNKEAMLGVIRRHRANAERLATDSVLRAAWGDDEGVGDAITMMWEAALKLGEEHGFRNSQVTVLAPTGTIGFMMDCDTTGIEPEIALVKYKKLVGGGTLKIVNGTVPRALERLGYSREGSAAILHFIDEQGTIESAPGLAAAHLPVFDCSFRPQNGTRSIHYMGHVRMMAAVQPFLSGAISKTVNMPNGATVEDVANAYVEGWKLGLKALAVYRDGCKRSQPVTTGPKAASGAKRDSTEGRVVRRRLPDERQSITHKFSIGGHEGYMTVGLYEDGTPGELFVTMAKEGSVVSGLMDNFATMISLGLQYGVPLKILADKFSHTRFEPSGFTGNPNIPMAKSITDYIFRWLALKFVPAEEGGGVEAQPLLPGVEASPPAAVAGGGAKPADAAAPGMAQRRMSVGAAVYVAETDAPPCSNCGAIMVRNGACYKCLNCGGTSGCS
jgi:ribonucleoside-diphosphate reductase alpha chain